MSVHPSAPANHSKNGNSDDIEQWVSFGTVKARVFQGLKVLDNAGLQGRRL